MTARAQAEPDPAPGAAVWLLSVGVTLGYASLMFAFGALLLPAQEATGWSKPALAGGLTLALCVAALASPLTGRLVDRGYGAETLVGSALWAGLVLLAVSRAQVLWQWYLAWALLGPAMAGMLYETCFAVLTRRLGLGARPAIIRVTLVAGLASTLAFGFGAFAAARLGWRGGWAAFGLLDILVAAPCYWLAGRLLSRGQPPGRQGRPPDRGAVRTAMRQPAFWCLTGAMALTWLNHTMLVTLFIPIFAGLGAGTGLATLAASVMGPCQVAGRLGLMLAGERATALPSTRLTLMAMACASLLLLAAAAEVHLILAFAVCQGAGIGIMSILRPVLTAEIMGRENFGAISGALAIGPFAATALAPVLGAGLFSAAGPAGLALTGAVMALAALLLLLPLRPRRA